MSGIAGIYGLDGRPVDRSRLQAMLDVMAHRGPDGSAAWSDGAVGLGHGMLHTTPESLRERMPLTGKEGRLALTADARIDNRVSLRKQLGAAEGSDEDTDSGLLLAAYQRWGEGLLDRVVGDFAFALWDADERKLFCAVDHLGVNQLYYVHRPHTLFCLASEIKALLQVEGIEAEIDEVRLGESLAWMRRPPDSTIFRGISKLPPASALIVDAEGMRCRRYWTVEPSDEARNLSKEACTGRFTELFKEAVSCRLRSAFPVGIELSGGLDSSFVAGMARRLVQPGGPPLKTLSLVYDQLPDCDERPYIQEVLAGGGLEPIYVHADRLGPLSTASELYDYIDDGRMGVGSTYRRWHLFKAAKANGVRVLLTGIDGDTTVSHGREYFYELASAERWDEFAREAELYVLRLGGERHRYATQEDPIDSPRYILEKMGYPYLMDWAYTGQWRRFARSARCISRLFSIPQYQLYRKFWRKLVAPRKLAHARRVAAHQARFQDVHPMVNAEFARRIELSERLAAYKQSSGQRPAVRAQQLNRFRIDAMAAELDYLNQYAAAQSLEARHPFMDIRLIQFCLGMPPAMSLYEGWPRAVMRWAMEGYVPDSIRWRTSKTNLQGVFDHALFEVDGALHEALMRDLGGMAPYVNQAYMADLIRRREENDELDFTLLASVMGKAIWLKKLRNRQKIHTSVT